MNATGIVRRLDDLGRIVIPREIRRTHNLRDGDPLEIFVSSDGVISLKKYAVLKESMDGVVIEYSKALSLATSQIVCVCDTDKFISGYPSLIGKAISTKLRNIMMEGELVVENKNITNITDGVVRFETKVNEQLIQPILLDGNSIGAVLFLSILKDKPITDLTADLARNTAEFVIKQIVK